MFPPALSPPSQEHRAEERIIERAERGENAEPRQLSKSRSGEPNPSDKTDTEDFCLLLLRCSGAARSRVSVRGIECDEETTSEPLLLRLLTSLHETEAHGDALKHPSVRAGFVKGSTLNEA